MISDDLSQHHLSEIRRLLLALQARPVWESEELSQLSSDGFDCENLADFMSLTPRFARLFRIFLYIILYCLYMYIFKMIINGD
jgi:hypothetical protein